ncbi:response regulator transcription factor [Paenibacillus sp. N3.4]|uniref:response regulator transcription factor n=1 Tax=Paenibacillus sp. N3.4 TaxID=2603222 RepID=UPI0016502614|nr:response regulator transcription factor [Paenibacillus sp. N3.4]
MWTIAIIDDDRKIVQSLCNAIPWEQFQLSLVGEQYNGVDGLELIRAVKPDIVIADIYMPQMNGLEMIETLRNEGFEGEFIILSGYSDFEYARQAIRLGVKEYLMKPVTLEELHHVLGRMIAELNETHHKQHEQANLLRKIQEYEPFVEKETLKAIITGTWEYGQEESLIGQKEWLANGNRYLVLGMAIHPSGRLERASMAEWSLFRFAVHNILEETASGEQAGVQILMLHNHQAVVLLWSSEEAADLMGLALRLAEQVSGNVFQYLKVKIVFGIGTVKQAWKQIADSTEEAFYAINANRHRILNRSEVYGYDQADKRVHAFTPEDSPTSKETRVRSVLYFQRISEAIRYNQAEEACRLVGEFAEHLTQLGSVTLLHLTATELWTIVKYAMQEVDIAVDDSYPVLEMQQEIKSLTDAYAFENWLTLKIRELCGSRQWKENHKHKEAVDFMVQYVHDHYGEEITLEELADKIYLSKNYLNQIFKKSTGETFANYLLKVRMEKAESLLLQGHCMIYEVAEKVGFNNVNYFSTVFKKVMGRNPSELLK